MEYVCVCVCVYPLPLQQGARSAGKLYKSSVAIKHTTRSIYVMHEVRD